MTVQVFKNRLDWCCGTQVRLSPAHILAFPMSTCGNPAAPFLVQVAANVPGKAAHIHSGAWVPELHVEDSEFLANLLDMTPCAMYNTGRIKHAQYQKPKNETFLCVGSS